MKKSLLIAAVLLVISYFSLFAAQSEQVELSINLNMNGTQKSNIGFTGQKEIDIVSDVPALDTITLNIGSDGCARNANGSLYFYYQIISTETVTVYIYGDKALTGNSGETVDWSLSSNTATYVDKKYGLDNKAVIHTHSPNAIGGTYGDAGTYELNIETDSLFTHRADDYKANIFVYYDTTS